MGELRRKFGQKLRHLRRQNHLTQEQLAEKIDVSVEFLSKLERGINAPSFETIEKISEALQIPYWVLFDFSE
jgi:transcriptional regulator with XRE-family HTH domain